MCDGLSNECRQSRKGLYYYNSKHSSSFFFIPSAAIAQKIVFLFTHFLKAKYIIAWKKES